MLNASAWIETFENVVTYSGFTENKWKQLVGKHIGSFNALKFRQLYEDCGSCSWAIFKRLFIEKFSNNYQKSVARSMIRRISVKDYDKFEDFVFDAYKYMENSGEEDPIKIAEELLGKLHPNVQRMIIGNMFSFTGDKKDLLMQILYAHNAEEQIKDSMKTYKNDLLETNNSKSNNNNQNILWEFRDIFSVDDFDFGLCKCTELDIKLKPGFKPIKSKPYRYNPKSREFIDKWIEIMLNKEAIRESNSTTSSPLVLVSAKGKAPRITIDYRRLNDYIKAEEYPTPTFQSIIDNLRGSKVFSIFDLTMSFYNIALKQDIRYLTAFITERGLFEFNRVPMGVKTSPKVLQKLIDMIIARYRWDFLNSYLDDWLTNSKTKEDHLIHIRKAFELLREHNLKVKPKKTQLFKEKLKFLGFELSSSGIEIDKNRINAILSLPAPMNQKQLRSFMGIMTFLKAFMGPQTTLHARNLFNLVKKDVVFEWTQEHQKSFDFFKQKLTTAPILTHPSEKCKKVLKCNASAYGIGGALCQVEDNVLKVISYYQKLLAKSQLHWSVCERELYAIIIGIRLFRKELIDQHFLIHSDNSALCSLNKIKPYNSMRLTRWAIEMSEFCFIVIYVKGSSNGMADCLSHLIVPKEDDREKTKVISSEKLIELISKDMNTVEDSNVSAFITRELHKTLSIIHTKDFDSETIEKYQKKDKLCKEIIVKLNSKDRKYRKISQRFKLFNNIL